MSTSDNSQDQREVQGLQRRIIDARTEGRYADQEEVLKKAVEAAGPLEELSLRVRARYYLAEAQQLQCKYKDSLDEYKWLIGLAPTYANLKLTDKNSLHYLAEAFIYFVQCGRYFPEYFPSGQAVEVLQQKIDEGLAWLKQIEMSHWAAGLYLQWGLLLKDQGKLEEARDKLQSALDLARECADSLGYTLGYRFATYQLELADLFCDTGFYAGAIHLSEEVLGALDSNINDRQRAYKMLIYARLEKGDMAALHSPTLKDQPLDNSLRSLGVMDNQILKQLQLIKEQLGQVAVALGRNPSIPSIGEQQVTTQAVQIEKLANEQVEQPGTSGQALIIDFGKLVYEQARDFSRLVYEQARDFSRLLQEQDATQMLPNISRQEHILRNYSSLDTPDGRSGGSETIAEHIRCLVALPSQEKDGNFHQVLLPALKQVLELEPFCWEVVCEDNEFIDSFEQHNVLAWLQRAQVYIADITSGNFKVMIELGAMLSAKKQEQPLLVLKEENGPYNFAGILGIIGSMLIEYPSTSDTTEHGIGKIADALKESFSKHREMLSVNRGKKAHYLSPLYLSSAQNDEVSRKLSGGFKTMESVEAATDDEFSDKAIDAGVPPLLIDGIKKMITDKLNEFRKRGI